jgi:hypothetical protein
MYLTCKYRVNIDAQNKKQRYSASGTRGRSFCVVDRQGNADRFKDRYGHRPVPWMREGRSGIVRWTAICSLERWIRRLWHKQSSVALRKNHVRAWNVYTDACLALAHHVTDNIWQLRPGRFRFSWLSSKIILLIQFQQDEMMHFRCRRIIFTASL